MSEYKGAEANESRECSENLADEGFVLGYPNSSGIVAKCIAGAKVYGVAEMDTKHPVTDAARTGIEVAILRKPKFANVQYNNGGGETIAVGDILSMKGANAAGACKKHVPTAWPGAWSNATAETISLEDAMIVGIALAAKAESTSGKVKCLLLCPIPTKPQ